MASILQNITPLTQKIWVLGSNAVVMQQLMPLLNLRYQTKEFKTFQLLTEYLQAPHDPSQEVWSPDLIIIDIFEGDHFIFRIEECEQKLNLPPFVAISFCDDLEIMRLMYRRGALDFILLPLVTNEIIAKIEQALNKTVSLNITHQVKNGSFDHQLTQKEMKILNYFLLRPNQLISKQELIHNVWENIYVNPTTLNVHLHNLRKKLLKSNIQIHNKGPGLWIHEA